MGFSGGQQESNQQSTSNPIDVTPGEYQALRPGIGNFVTNLLGGGGGYTGPTSQTTPGAGEMSALSALTGQANDPTRQGYIQSVLRGDFLPGRTKANPFLEAAISAAQGPTMRNLQQTLERALPGRFALAGHLTNRAGQSAGGGGGSSAFDRAAGDAATTANQQMLETAAKMSSENFAQERDQQTKVAALSQQEIQGLNASLQAEALPRLIQSMGVQEGIQVFNDRIKSLLAALGLVAQPNIGQTSQSTGESEGWNAGVDFRQK